MNEHIEHPKDPRFRDLTGKIFDNLIVISYAGKEGGKHYWNCRCSCGQERKILRSNLTRKTEYKHCGCLRAAKMSQRFSTHRQSKSVTYKSYTEAKARCQCETSHAYNQYGGAGIKFLFDSFEEFLDEIGERPDKSYSLDRIDNNGNYEIGNIRWATQTEQCNNKSNNKLLTHEGVTKTLSQWCGGSRNSSLYARIQGRLKCGWCFSCALTKNYCEHNLEARPSRIRQAL